MRLALVFIFVSDRGVFEICGLDLRDGREIVLIDDLALSHRAPDTFVLDLVQLKIIREAYAREVVPHIAKITADHHVGTVFWLSTDAEDFLVKVIDLLDLPIVDLLLVDHPSLKIFDGPNFKDSLREYLPDSGDLLEGIKELNQLSVCHLSDLNRILLVLL